MSVKAALALAWMLPAPALAQAHPLNDTGQTQCDNGNSTLVACTAANTGNGAAYPGQDGRFGRDRAPLTKIGGGAAGFDFTALDANGQPNHGIGLPGNHACVQDNTTGLIWEVRQTASHELRYAGNRYTWHDSIPASPACNRSLCNTQTYVATVNSLVAGDRLCGQTDWRLPTRRELLSIVHNGTYDPAIDTTYFPDVGSPGDRWWTSDAYASVPGSAYIVNFYNGSSGPYHQSNNYSVRLVRSRR